MNKLFYDIEIRILNLEFNAQLDDLQQIITSLKGSHENLGAKILLESKQAWQMLLRMYNSTMPESSFLNYYWSWRGLLSAFYTCILTSIPKAQVYHSLSTGYAGLLMARAVLETGKPGFITEHGIYTNERRMEIATANWLYDLKAMDLAIGHPQYVRDLRDFWISTFEGYSKLAYQAATKIITIYEGNREFQLMDGAEKSKIKIIPNGVDVEKFSAISRVASHPPTIALIGRVVPIKDVKSFIYAVSILKERIPTLRAWILGSAEEDPEYYEDCLDQVISKGLGSTITFTGNVDVKEYLGSIDVLVLTSLSEGQPLSVLEAGAAGVPCVATNVGSCSELIYGATGEEPALGAGGAVCGLANPVAIADEAYKLLTDPAYYDSCSKTMKNRVRTYYHKEDQRRAYHELYHELLKEGIVWQA